MSKVCPSCGGIIGRDCFNPQECAWITQQMEYDQAHPQNQEPPQMEPQDYINQLEREVEALKGLIKDSVAMMAKGHFNEAYKNLNTQP